MGMFDNCCCCCCLSREAAVKVCTYLVMLYYIFSVVMEILSFNHEPLADFIISLIVDIAILTSLILLLIGIKKRKRSYMKQFDTFFGILYVLTVIGFVFVFIGSVTSFISYLLSDKEDLIETVQLMNPDDWKEYQHLSNDEINRKIIISYVIKIGGLTLFMFLFTYYYFFTRKFIIDTVKEIDNENKNKQLEEGNKV